MSQEQPNSTTSRLLEQALSYTSKYGWSVIPVGKDKKPLIAWKQYQKQKASEDQIKKWWTTWPNANIGVVTGRVSNLNVVDIDPRHGGSDEKFKDIRTVCVKTGGKGYHYYFTYAEGIQNKAGIQPGIDIRGEAGYVVLPPSVHESGDLYEWINSPENTSILPLPDFVKQWVRDTKFPTKQEKNNKEDTKAFGGVDAGNRNEAAASVAGSLLSKYSKDEWDVKVWPLFRAWNRQNTPPLEEKELRVVFDSISARETEQSAEESENASYIKRIMSAIIATQTKFFHDQYKEGYAAINGNGTEVIKIRSREFETWLAGFVWTWFADAVSNDMMTKIIRTLECKAIYDGTQYVLHNRVARINDELWYDLGPAGAIHVNKNSWKIMESPPILFRKYAHQKGQVLPETEGNISELCKFVNLKEEQERLLFLVFVVASFVPGFPHPMLVLFGQQGAGKTTPQKLIKSLVDPSRIKSLTAPDNIQDFVLIASHHYFYFFDNLSSLNDWISDALARAVTGDGFSTRKLYTNDEDQIFSFQSVIGLNGIPLVVTKADLLDRSILLELERIPKEKRMLEQDFWNQFELVKPKILGAIMTALSKALELYSRIKLSSYPRMADFTRWGCAIAEAIGYTQQEFLDAYYANISSQNNAAIDASPIATAIHAFMNDKPEAFWEGQPNELLDILDGYAKNIHIDTRSKVWPKDPAWLTRRLKFLVPNLKETGIEVQFKNERPRKIRLEKEVIQNENADILTENTDIDRSDNPSVNGQQLVLSQNTDGLNKASQQSPSVPTAFSVKQEDTSGVKQYSKILKREEMPELTDVEYEIYLQKAWNQTEKELSEPPTL